jgi:hypothetical protein
MQGPRENHIALWEHQRVPRLASGVGGGSGKVFSREVIIELARKDM